jgi:hypothetical protein
MIDKEGLEDLDKKMDEMKSVKKANKKLLEAN